MNREANVEALRSMIRLERIEKAYIVKDLWTERHNHAVVMIQLAKDALAAAQKDSDRDEGPV